jgi:hypothetical protein
MGQVEFRSARRRILEVVVKFWTIFIASICFCLAGAQSGRNAEVQQQYDRYAKAYVQNDVETMLSILAPEYKLVKEDGKVVDRAEYKKTLLLRRERNERTSAYTVSFRVISFRQGVLTVESREVQKGSDGANHAHVYRDRWRKMNGVWKLLSTRSLSHG